MNLQGNEWYNRWVNIRHLTVAAFLVTAFLLFVRFNYEGGPLTSTEMLSHYTYDKNELAAAIGKSLSPLNNCDRRWDLYERWQMELKRHTPAERRRIRSAAVTRALREAMREADLLAADQRPAFIDMLFKLSQGFQGDDSVPVSSEDIDNIVREIPADQAADWSHLAIQWLRQFPVEQW